MAKKLTLKKLASGEHAVMDGDQPMGTIDHGYLMGYADQNREDLNGVAADVTDLQTAGLGGKGPAATAFAKAIRARMAKTRESFQLAELNLVSTHDGAVLYEQARAERMEAAGKVLP